MKREEFKRKEKELRKRKEELKTKLEKGLLNKLRISKVELEHLTKKTKN